jgi:hypothetical protein
MRRLEPPRNLRRPRERHRRWQHRVDRDATRSTVVRRRARGRPRSNFENEVVRFDDATLAAEEGAKQNADARAAETSQAGADVRDVARVIEACARALHAAHELNVIHRT